jgi:hypothetical protein
MIDVRYKEKPSALKRKDPAFKTLNISSLSTILWVIFPSSQPKLLRIRIQKLLKTSVFRSGISDPYFFGSVDLEYQIQRGLKGLPEKEKDKKAHVFCV